MNEWTEKESETLNAIDHFELPTKNEPILKNEKSSS